MLKYLLQKSKLNNVRTIGSSRSVRFQLISSYLIAFGMQTIARQALKIAHTQAKSLVHTKNVIILFQRASKENNQVIQVNCIKYYY